MKSVRCLGKSKKGQFGFDLMDIFSYIGYFVVVLLIIIILSLPSCLTGIKTDKAQSKLHEKTQAMALVSADAQLTSYLRTQMPGKDELFEMPNSKLNWLDEHRNFLKTSAVDPTTGTALPDVKVNLDVDKAKGFLNSHPEVYVDKDYSEFLSSLQAIYATSNNERDDVKMTFKVVTAAMFLSGFSDAKKQGGYIYYLPQIDVDFQNRNPGTSGKDGYYELSISIMPKESLPDRKPVEAIQMIPLADGTLAKIRLTYNAERSSWLPQA